MIRHLLDKITGKNNIEKKEHNPCNSIIDDIELGKRYCTQHNIENNFTCDNEIVKNGKNIMIVDDNFGIVSILSDLIKDIDPEANIIQFYGDNAALMALCFIDECGENVNYTILDILLGGTIYCQRLVRITGFHLFFAMHQKTSNFKNMFYTGSSVLNGNDYSSDVEECYRDKTGHSIIDDVTLKSLKAPSALKDDLRRLLSEN